MAEIGRPVRVRGTLYDGVPHWEHPAWLVMERNGLLITQTFAGLTVARDGEPWLSPYDTRGHYWPDRWYNVIRLDLPRGRGLHGWYCNVATPAEFDGENLHYVDLQIDVIVHAGTPHTWEVRDEDEFEAAIQTFRYPESLVREARAAVDKLVALVLARQFPFDVRS